MKRSESDRLLDRAWADYIGKPRARMPREMRAILIAAFALEEMMDPRTIAAIKQTGDNFSAIVAAASGKKP